MKLGEVFLRPSAKTRGGGVFLTLSSLIHRKMSRGNTGPLLRSGNTQPSCWLSMRCHHFEIRVASKMQLIDSPGARLLVGRPPPPIHLNHSSQSTDPALMGQHCQIVMTNYPARDEDPRCMHQDYSDMQGKPQNANPDPWVADVNLGELKVVGKSEPVVTSLRSVHCVFKTKSTTSRSPCYGP